MPPVPRALEQDPEMIGYFRQLNEMLEEIAGYVNNPGTSAERLYKTADESLDQDTTYQDDDHLAGFTVEAAAWYAITGFLDVATHTTPDFKAQLSFSQTPQDGNWMASGTGSSANFSGDHSIGITAELSITAPSSEVGLAVFGVVLGHASANGTLTLQWAQRTSSVNTTGLNAGSWMQLEKLSS